MPEKVFLNNSQNPFNIDRAQPANEFSFPLKSMSYNRVVLDQIFIQNWFSNLTSLDFSYQQNGNIVQFQIPEGYYDIDTLIVALTPFTITPNTLKKTIDTITINAGGSWFPVGLGWVHLGFNVTRSQQTEQPIYQFGNNIPGPYNLQYGVFFIACRQFSNDGYLSFCVQVNSGYGGQISLLKQENYTTVHLKRIHQDAQLDFTLLDRFRRPLRSAMGSKFRTMFIAQLTLHQDLE